VCASEGRAKEKSISQKQTPFLVVNLGNMCLSELVTPYMRVSFKRIFGVHGSRAKLKRIICES